MAFRFLILHLLFLINLRFIKCMLHKTTPVAIIQDIYQCKDFTPSDTFLNINIKNFNKTQQTIDANITLPDQIDKTFKFKATLYRFLNNRWHKDVALAKDDPCNTLRLSLGSVYDQLLKAVHVKGCPIKPGFYSIHDFLFDSHVVPMAYATGLFKLDLRIYKKPNILKICYQAESIINFE